MSKEKARGYYQHDTTAGSERLDGACVALVSWWIDQGGLSELEAVADQCSFESLAVKRDDTLGELVLAQRDFGGEMLASLRANPVTAHMLEIAGVMPHETLPQTLRENYSRGAARTLRYRLEQFVGHHLQTWYRRNEKRIKKERDRFKAVRQVMES